MEKWHLAKKRKEKKTSTFATFSTTLSDNFQKKSTFFFQLFSVRPAMNLWYITDLSEQRRVRGSHQRNTHSFKFLDLSSSQTIVVGYISCGQISGGYEM